MTSENIIGILVLIVITCLFIAIVHRRFKDE